MVSIRIQDRHGKAMVIQIRNFDLGIEESFDCVTLSARYDHGFGFSQLFRFVNDKESKEIKVICDATVVRVITADLRVLTCDI